MQDDKVTQIADYLYGRVQSDADPIATYVLEAIQPQLDAIRQELKEQFRNALDLLVRRENVQTHTLIQYFNGSFRSLEADLSALDFQLSLIEEALDVNHDQAYSPSPSS
jgi:hypothetical protein